jgi:hypothetical protein
MTLSAEIVSAWYNALPYSKIIVITGAGASVPLGMPAMDGFYKQLDPGWQNWISPIFESFGSDKKNDLEELLERLTEYEQLKILATHDGKVRNTVINLGAANDLVDQSRQFREHIFDRIVATCGRITGQPKQKAVGIYRQLYLDLLDATGNSPKVLPVFTTNYDLTFEAIRELVPDFTLCNGLQSMGEDRVWSSTTYRKQELYNFAVFRLHGCSHWFRFKSDGTEQIIYQALPDRRDIENKGPCILYPLPGKDDRTHEEPFQTGYEELRRCLMSDFCKTIVIIGYSGRDEIVQGYLRDASVKDPEKRFIVVTKRDQFPEGLAKAIPKLNRLAHLRGGIEYCKERVIQALQGTLPEVARASLKELRAVYEKHNDKSAWDRPQEEQCQCDECKEFRARSA